MLFSSLPLSGIIILIPVALFALTAHEFSHGYVAALYGDPTARMQGRLTFNPLKHLDPMGTLAILLVGFGWAKPVPVDPRYFKDPKKAMMVVSLAGPGANLLIVMVSYVAYRLLEINGDAIPVALLQPLTVMFYLSILVNSILAIFNMIPLPPLDGSKVLMGLLPAKQAYAIARLEGHGFMIILGLLILDSFTGILGGFLRFFQNILFAILSIIFAPFGL